MPSFEASSRNPDVLCFPPDSKGSEKNRELDTHVLFPVFTSTRSVLQAV